MILNYKSSSSHSQMQKKPKIKSLNSLICQVKPVFKDKAANIKRLQQSLAKYSTAHKLDIVMFPQLAFIGYNFKNYQDIFPYTQKAESGQSFEFCQKLAQRLSCYVIYGYAERQKNTEDEEQSYSLYNSVCLIGRHGQTVLNARKTHMYSSDELWCCAGSGFQSITINNINNQPINCAIGVCMDINPKGFTSGKYELADFIVSNQSEVLLFLSAWNDHEPNAINEQKSQMGIVNYWMNRLMPVMKAPKDKRKSLLVLVCDRAGEQITYTNNKAGKTNFIGTSCIFRMNPQQLIEKLGKKNQDFLNVSTWISNEAL